MSCGIRTRQDSECSTLSTDSSLLDGNGNPSFSAVDAESAAQWKRQKRGVRLIMGRNPTCCIAVASLCISVVCIVFSGCLCFYVLKFRQEVSPEQRMPGASPQHAEDATVCMPCDELSGSLMTDAVTEEADLDLDLLDVSEGKDGRSSCCASTPAQYAALFKLIFRRQEGVKKLADLMTSAGSPGQAGPDGGSGRLPVVNVTSGNAVSAHLISKPTSHTKNTDALTIQQWKSDKETPLSHVRPGLVFQNNKVYVLVEGLYFIYCQILYTKTVDDPGFPGEVLVSNYVERYSTIYPSSSGILLKSRHTSMETDRHSSWVGGLFYLYPQDQLWVKVALPELVAHDDMASFFGLFRIGN